MSHGPNRYRAERRKAEEEASRGGQPAPADPHALRVLEAWNARARRGRPALFFPTFETALAAGCSRLTYCCPACRQLLTADLRDYADAHHLRAPISALIPKLSCNACCPNPPLVVIVELERPGAELPVVPTLSPPRARAVEERSFRAPETEEGKSNVADCRRLKLTHLRIYCTNGAAYCSHSSTLPIAGLPDELLLIDIEKRFRCQRCGAMKAEVRPDYGPLTPAPSGGGPR